MVQASDGVDAIAITMSPRCTPVRPPVLLFTRLVVFEVWSMVFMPTMMLELPCRIVMVSGAPEAPCVICSGASVKVNAVGERVLS